MSAIGSGGAAKAASVVLQSGERVLQPGLANLLKAIVVARSAAHSIEILRNDRMVGIWQRKPIQLDVSVIAGGRCHAQADKGPPALPAWVMAGRSPVEISHDHVRSRSSSTIGLITL